VFSDFVEVFFENSESEGFFFNLILFVKLEFEVVELNFELIEFFSRLILLFRSIVEDTEGSNNCQGNEDKGGFFHLI